MMEKYKIGDLVIINGDYTFSEIHGFIGRVVEIYTPLHDSSIILYNVQIIWPVNKLSSFREAALDLKILNNCPEYLKQQ